VRQKRFLLSVVLLATLAGGVVGQNNLRGARDAVRRGNERYARAEYEAAIEEYRRVHADAGELYAQALYNVGVCYYELWRTDDAIKMYARAAEAMQGRYPKALYALGVALKMRGESVKRKRRTRGPWRRPAGNTPWPNTCWACSR